MSRELKLRLLAIIYVVNTISSPYWCLPGFKFLYCRTNIILLNITAWLISDKLSPNTIWALFCSGLISAGGISINCWILPVVILSNLEWYVKVLISACHKTGFDIKIPSNLITAKSLQTDTGVYSVALKPLSGGLFDLFFIMSLFGVIERPGLRLKCKGISNI